MSDTGTIVLYAVLLVLLGAAATQLGRAARQRRRQFLALYPAPEPMPVPHGAAYVQTMGFIGTAEGGIDQGGGYLDILVIEHGFVASLIREPQVRLYFPWSAIADVSQGTRYGSPFTRIALAPLGQIDLYGDPGLDIYGGWRTWRRQQPKPTA